MNRGLDPFLNRPVWYPFIDTVLVQALIPVLSVADAKGMVHALFLRLAADDQVCVCVCLCIYYVRVYVCVCVQLLVRFVSE